jgi:hypothetical protein
MLYRIGKTGVAVGVFAAFDAVKGSDWCHVATFVELIKTAAE